MGCVVRWTQVRVIGARIVAVSMGAGLIKVGPVFITVRLGEVVVTVAIIGGLAVGFGSFVVVIRV